MNRAELTPWVQEFLSLADCSEHRAEGLRVAKDAIFYSRNCHDDADALCVVVKALCQMVRGLRDTKKGKRSPFDEALLALANAVDSRLGELRGFGPMPGVPPTMESETKEAGS